MATLSKITIEGFRSIDRLSLDLEGLIVLIGVNGSGKSSILEAIEILHLIGSRTGDFYECFVKWHGGQYGTFRRAPAWVGQMTLGVEVDDDDRRVAYDVTFSEQNGYVIIERERLTAGDLAIERSAGALRGHERFIPPGGFAHAVGPNVLVIPQLAPLSPDVRTVLEALGNIDVHLPFETLPRWAARQHKRSTPMRDPATVENTPERLDALGENLVQVLQEIRSGGDPERWRGVMEDVRLGLGEGIEDVRIRTEQGRLRLELRLRGVGPDISIDSLSEGQLAYLALVALFHLEAHHAGYFGARSLLAFDEPDLHLHPAAIARIVQMFERAAMKHPVIVATQSDAFLDHLANPAATVRVCDLDEVSWATRVRKLDKEALTTWLQDYRGLGSLRSNGYLNVVTRP